MTTSSIAQTISQYAHRVQQGFLQAIGRVQANPPQVVDVHNTPPENALDGAALETARNNFRQQLEHTSAKLAFFPVTPQPDATPGLLTLTSHLEAELQSLQLGDRVSALSVQEMDSAKAALSCAEEVLSALDSHDPAAELGLDSLVDLSRRAHQLEQSTHLGSLSEALEAITSQALQVLRQHETQGSAPAFSVKDVAHHHSASYQAAITVIDDIINRVSSMPVHGSDEARTQQLSALKAYRQELKEQVIGFEVMQVKPEASASEARTVCRLMGGKSRHPGGWIGRSIPFMRERSAIRQAGQLGQPMPQGTRRIHLHVALAEHMASRLRHCGVPADQLASMGKLNRRIEQAFCQGLQTSAWRNISRQHTITLDDPNTKVPREHHFQSQLIRARELSPELAQRYAEHGLEGVSCMASHEDRHCVNLWQTRFEPQSPPSGQTNYAFSAMRHGVHDAYGIHDPQMRQQANDRRVAEFVQATAQANPERLKENPDGSYSLRIASINLLTPRLGDREKIEQQNQSYVRAEETGREQGFEVTLHAPDGSSKVVQVRPQFLTFNTGVNIFSVGPVSGLANWSFSDAINRQGLVGLMGSLDAREPMGGAAAEKWAELEQALAQPGLDDNARRDLRNRQATLQMLVTDIRQIMADSSHHVAGSDPYKLPVRLAALAHECGVVPAFNCKSGKDRTGVLDVEIRDFYAHLNAHQGQPRAPGVRREGLEAQALRILYQQSGSREVQRFNTGVPGTKNQLGLYHTLMGLPAGRVDELRGLSGWVGS